MFLGLIEVGGVASGLAHVTLSPALARAVIVLAFAGAAAYGVVLRRGAMRREGHPAAQDRLRWSVRVAATVAALLYAYLWWVAAQRPDLSWDGNTCHIPTLHAWTLKGYVHWIDCEPSEWTGYVSSSWNGTPKGVHLLAFVFLRATHAEWAINAINLPFLPLGVVGLYCIARALGARRNPSVVAGLCYLVIPINLAQTQTTYVDSATASLFILFIALVSHVCSALARRPIPWRYLPGVGAAMGLALAAKTTGVVLAPVGAAVLVVCLVMRARRTRTEASSAVPSGASETGSPSPASGPHDRPACGRRRVGRDALVFAALVIVIAAAVGGYWSVRNYVHTGSPIHPAGLSIGSLTVFPGLTPRQLLNSEANLTQVTARWSQPRRVLFNWLQGLNHWPQSIQWYDSRDGGFGFLWLVGCVPAIVALAVCAGRRMFSRRPPPEWIARVDLRVFVVVFVLIGITFLLRPLNQYARHTFWVYALGLPCWAVVAGAAWHASSLPRRIPGKSWFGLCAMLVVLEGLYCLSWNVSRYYSTGTGTVIDEYTLTHFDPAGYIWPELSGTLFERVLEDDAPVAVGWLSDRNILIVGQLCQPLGRRRVLFLSREVAADGDALAAFLQSRGMRYVVWDGTASPPRALEDSATRHETVDRLLHVFEIPPLPGEGPA